MAEPNAIMQRVERLNAQWAQFVEDPQARCLHWLIEPDEWRMIDMFCTVEETDDVFVQLDAPFQDSQTHGLRLRRWLHDEYRAIEPQLAEAGIVTGWTPPRPDPASDDIDAFVAAAESMWEHHQPLGEHLVLLLVPTAVRSADDWKAWLERLLDKDAPHLRFVVVDYKDSASLAQVARTRATQVRTVVADLDMGGAYQELSLAAGGLDKPAGEFRHAFVLMSNAMSTGDMATAEGQAGRAKAVARAQSWPHLVFAVDFARGSGYLGAADPRKAIECYRAAEASAQTAERDGEDYGPSLLLKARLGQGAACVSAEAYAPGAKVYESAAPMAREANDARTELDCLRMASYCHERSRAYTKAWDRGVEAVAVGSKMDEDTRHSSTLPHAGEALLRLCKNPRLRGGEASVEAQMRALLGDDWRPS